MGDLDTSAAILDAAEELFAEQGFTATTIKQIGARAGVTPALIYYYFDDKDALYQAMLARLLGSFADAGLRRLAGADHPAEAIRTFVSGQVETVLQRPNFARILTRELVDRSALALGAVSEILAGLFGRLCEVVEQGQRRGVFRADLDPRFAAISTVAQIAYMMIARPAVGIVLGYGPGGPPDDVVRGFGRHAAEFALAALAAPAAVPAPAPDSAPEATP